MADFLGGFVGGWVEENVRFISPANRDVEVRKLENQLYDEAIQHGFDIVDIRELKVEVRSRILQRAQRPD